jgi:hypothetical protein
MRAAAALAMGVALLAAPSAQAVEGMVTLGSGLRPYGIAGFGLLTGGGLRAGPTFGPVTLFGGGFWNATKVTLADDDAEEDMVVRAKLWSAQAGVRVGFGKGDVDPYILGGGVLHHWGGDLEFVGDDDLAGLDLRSGPGGFFGGGADVNVVGKVGLGVEVGVAGAMPVVEAWSQFGKDEDKDFVVVDVRTTWVYSNVHLIIRFGGGR